jgi:hypothetical protein
LCYGALLAAGCTALAACAALTGGSSSATPSAATLSARPATTRPAAATPTAARTGTEPGILAVTKAGALVRLSTATGAVTQTLVPSGVTGDEISAANGTVYFTAEQGHTCSVESVPEAGGTPTVVAPGGEPAISPDGTKLAYTKWPYNSDVGCAVQYANPGTSDYLIIRTLATGQTATIPQQAPQAQGELVAPISHLSWSADGSHLAVSLATVEDNEGWALNLIDVATAKTYVPGPGASMYTAATEKSAQATYLREGVYLPDGDLFLSQACCEGIGENADKTADGSRLLLEASPAGAEVKQVAIGYANLTHDSLAVSPDGTWLLYVGGTSLYVSKGGAIPKELSGSGFLAAAWG